jgi:hypothetical protein
MAGYSRQSLIEGIEQCHKNIETFNEAIRKEHETIAEYKFYIQKIDEHEKLEKQIKENVTNDS